MGTRKLVLLVLIFSSSTLAQEDGSDSLNPTCLKDSSKFKHLRKYVYNYEAGTSTGVTGTADSQSGSKFNCKVELEVPQPCSFILRIKQCTLREVYGFSSEGKALLKKSKNSEEFSSAMSKNDVSFSISYGKQIVLYPQADEPLSILNIKRGIISALLVPEDAQNEDPMDTVYGKCSSEVAVSTSKGTTVADGTVVRNLKNCDRFTPIRDYVSPIALFKGLNAPLSTLIKSSQSCQYTLETKRKQVTEVSCAESHIFLPFSNKGQYGITAKVTQSLKLEDTSKTNNREFLADPSLSRGLALEASDSVTANEDVLENFEELKKMSTSGQNQQRAGRFYKLVRSLRSLNNETLGPLVPKMTALSSPIALQALVQCGTAECFGAILQILRSGYVSPMLTDAVTYSLGLLPSPCTKRVRELLNMAQYQKSRATFYALGHAVSNFYEDTNTVTEDLKDVADYMTSLIANECSGDKDHTFLALKAIGIMGKAMENANAEIKSSLLQCARSRSPSDEIQKAAIQAFRRMTITREVQESLVGVFQDSSSPAQKRLAAYLMVMKDPSESSLREITNTLNTETNEQVKNFVASHIVNILKSEAPETQLLKGNLEELLKDIGVPEVIGGFTKLSRNYQISKNVHVPGADGALGAKLEGNVIFDSGSYMPEETMLEATLDVFGQSFDMFEVSIEGKGFQPTLDALFGKGGFFPDCTMKALYWADGKVPDKVTEILFKWFNVPRGSKPDQDFTKAMLPILEKLIKDVRASDAPEAKAYLEILGKELGYIKLSDLKIIENIFPTTFQTLRELPARMLKAMSRGIDEDLFLHYIFLDNEFDLPTGSGLQLQVSLSGTVAPGAKAGTKFSYKNAKAEFSLKPAISLEFVTQLGVQIPGFSKHAVQMNSNLFHETGAEAAVSLKDGQIRFSIPAPKGPTKLFSFSNNFNLVYAAKTEVMASIAENRNEWSSCRPLLTGLKYCINTAYSNASTKDEAPYFPLTGQTRFELEIQPTGDVEEYSLTASYRLNKDGRDLVDTLVFSAQAEGAKSCEATWTTKYNRNKITFSSDVQIPKSAVDFGVGVKVDDQSPGLYSVVVDFHNQQISEVTLTGKLSSAENEATLSGVLSIPRLHSEAKAEASVQNLLNVFKLQLQSSANICAFSGSQNIVFTYDNDKIELEWSTDSNSNLKKLVSKLPDIRFEDMANYPESMKNYANDVLDYKVPQTDMTLRHIVSQSFVAANNWLRTASKDMPYATTLHSKLSALKELDFQGLGLPPFPEELFLNSDGKIKYLLNKDGITINIPLPFGGKSSHQVMMTSSLRTPSVDMPSVRFRLPSQEFKIPAFTIPEHYQLRVPLIGVLELSSNIKSNYYNWSASYTGGNTSSDATTFSSKYNMGAKSVLDILSYDIDGSALISYDPEQMLRMSYEGSTSHSLLESSIKLHELYNFRSNEMFKGSYSYTIRSILGIESSLTSSMKSTKNNKIVITEGDAAGEHKLASLFLNTDYNTVLTLDTESLQAKSESNFKMDSSYLKVTNKISGMALRDALTITSTTDMQDGALSNTMTLDYRNKQLSFKSDTTGNYYNLVALNKFEATLSSKMAAIRSEYQADYRRHRLYTLLSGSLNSLGLELNADATLNNQQNRGAHKATLKLNQEGLSTSATTNINFSPLTLENEFNAGIGPSGALMKMTANGRYRENNAKVTVSGKAALTELSFGSVYQATLLGLDSKNILNFRISKEGLKFFNNLMGSYDQIKLENSHELNIERASIQFTSKFDNTLSSDKSYKQSFELQMQPYTVTALLNNEFQYGLLALTNKGQMQLEGFKMNFNGNLQGAYDKDEVKHSYALALNGLSTNLNTDTVANIQGTAHSHRVSMEIAGLSASFSSNSNCETKSVRFTNRIQSVVAPFSFKFDSQTTGDGRLQILGDHTGQLYSKVLLNAEILSFNFVHDYRGSTRHLLDNGRKHETLLDYQIATLFTPSEQLSSWKLKSHLDQNSYSHSFRAYNNLDTIGVELSGKTAADMSVLDRQIQLPFAIFNPIDALNLRDSVNTPQEFGISGYVKYDKNKDMHVINLPFMESMSASFEEFRNVLLTSLQAVQKYLKNIDIDQHLKTCKATLSKIPQKMNDYINSLDVEAKLQEAKKVILSLTEEYKITAEELQSAIENYFNLMQENLQQYMTRMEGYINDYTRWLERRIHILVQNIFEQLKALDEEYQIRKKFADTIQDLRKIVEEMNIDDLQDSVKSWIQNVDDMYQIKKSFANYLQQIQAYIQKIDIQVIEKKVEEFLKSVDWRKYAEEISKAFPLKTFKYIIEQAENVVVTMFEEYELSEKITAVVDKLQDIVTEYEIDKKIQMLIEKFLQFLSQQNVRETIQKAADMLNSIDVKTHFNKIRSSVDDAVKKVKDYDYKSLIDDINYYLDVVIKKIKSFNYDKFVDDVNEWIRAGTKTINDQMKALELPQKAEALKQYLDDVRKVAKEYIQQLGETKFSAVIQWYQEIMSSAVLNDFKVRIMENLEDARDRIYSMDIKKECQRYLENVSQAYRRLVTCISEKWNALSEMITSFAEENDIREWAENVKRFIEEGFTVQGFKLGFLNIPSFEVSLRALRLATFKTPDFVVPFTDLQVPSVEINFRRLRELEIPTRIVTPEFTIFNTYKVPSYTIDLNEIKVKVARTIDQILSSDFKLPSPEVYLKDLRLSDLTMNDMGFPAFSIPEIYVPSMQIPELRIPKLNLINFDFSDISIPEFQLPKIPHTVSVPTFGKLHSSFEVTSPFFTMKTSAEVKNATVSENSPEFVATLSSEATSMMEALAFVLAADARVSAPLLEQLILKESVLLSNKYVKFDHNGEMTFSRNQIQTKIGTKANLKTEKNSAEFQNDMSFKLQKKFTADINTKYSHRLNVPRLEITSQLELQNDIDSTVEAGRILFTSAGKGNWKWACPLFTDEGTHQADFKFNLRGPLIEISGANRVIDKYLKLDQSIRYDSGFLSYVNLDIMSKADCPYVGNSIVEVKGKAQVSEMKIELTAAHNAELSGRATGTISNSLSFLTKPFEIRLSTNNNGNLKVSFPMRLTGKIDFLNNYEFILSPNVQQASWQVNGRFNQYKASHAISLGNNEEKIGASVEMNGEANLDFLTIPITIPEIPVPYTTMKTPKVTSFSLWERSGLKNLLTTTKQNFDLNIKLQYMKNKDVHLIPLPLEAIYDTINSNMVTLNKKFEKVRGAAVNVLTNSYNGAKAQFEKYKIDTQANKIPRTLRIPGYTIPLVNIDVSPFVAELPAFGYVIPKEIRTPGFTLPVLGFSIPMYTLVMPSLEFSVLHVPNTLRRISLPKLTLPRLQNSISIPAMGNLTYEFAFKSNVISLTTSAGLYNQSDISARFSVISTSVIDALQFSIDGTSGLTRKRGLKLATGLALKNAFVEGKHESSMSFGRRNIEASVATNGKINIPILQLIYNHELTGNTKTKPTVSSKMTMSYDFNEAAYGNNAKGSLDHNLNLEGLSSYLSLESLTKGHVTGTFMSHQPFSGKLSNEASTYLNSNGLRSSMKTVGNAKADGFATLDVAENLAVEASTSRIYAVWEHVGENDLRYTPAFTTRGSQKCKATIELSFWSLLSNVQLQFEQPSSFFDAVSLSEAMTLNLYPEKQEFDFNGQGVLEYFVVAHNIKLSNDPTDAKCEIGGSLQGHVDVLKSIILPIYEKSVWDVLKFDLTTSAKEKQYLSLSTSLVYTKNKEGFFFPIPVNKLSDGFVIKFPALTLKSPEWIKDLPNKISNVEMPDMPTELNIPSFKVPFTNLNVPSYNIDLSNIKIHKKLSTLPFDLTLPSLPKVKFPKVDINTKYITLEEYKIPFFEVTIPQYQITLARYTLPKSYYGLDFNSLANKIADIDLPTIEIPEQNIEFPPVKLNLPAGLFIPAFGSLSGSVQLNSPIYNLTWTTKLANSSESLVASIDATSSSTLQFLEFDLEASATSSLVGKALNFIGKGTLAHPDLSIDWQQDISFNGLRFPSHNVLIDVRSPTFTNVQIRCQRENNKLSSSVTCTSTGTLGLVIEKEDAIIKGKVYTRSLTSTGKDNLLMKGEISLKNPEKIQNKFNWKEDAVQEALYGLKERLPKMSDAVYNCFNKYHTEHFGMDVSDAHRKMKEHLQSKITSTYRSTVNQIDKIEYELQSAARHASSRYSDIMKNAKKMYQDPASTFPNYDDVKARFLDNTVQVLRRYQNTVKDLIDAAIEFLKMTRFQLPGQTQRYTGEELLSMGVRKVMSCIDHCYEKIQKLFDACIQSLNNVKFDIPGTQITIEGTQILASIKNFLKELNTIIRDVFTDIQNASLEKTLKQLQNVLQQVGQKSEKLIEAMQFRNYEELKAQIEQMYKDTISSEYAKKLSYYADRVKKILQQLQTVLQSGYEQLSEKLEQLLIYGKALREEYLDPNIVGWSVKYYEIEDKIIQLVKNIINSLKELPSKYGTSVSEALDNVRGLLTEYYQQAGDAEDRAREMFNRMSVSLNEKITELSNSARKVAVELNQVLSSRLQGAYDKFANSYEKFIVEANRLIDLVIEKYNAVIEFIMQVLQDLEQSSNEVVKTYISTRKGELKIDVPHPFNWKSFDEMPELRDDIINKKLEIARSVVVDGIERGSKKWEELQSFIEQQLKDGKLTAQQIIENIKNWEKN
ncbi:apolipoprotein B-100 [Spea bombifrons]|uniref:apolipoprotein B-100 n=1 Tax=Spea bombifrons TaxID=233779 RepID=UPI0023491145|nr:apolipoprotein B-100 [Spea bombifrons]